MTAGEIASWAQRLPHAYPKKVYHPAKPRYAAGDFRRMVYDRDAGQCQYCGRLLSFYEANFDHVVPWPHGWTEASNIVVACGDCNRLKGRAMIPKELRPL